MEEPTVIHAKKEGELRENMDGIILISVKKDNDSAAEDNLLPRKENGNHLPQITVNLQGHDHAGESPKEKPAIIIRQDSSNNELELDKPTPNNCDPNLLLSDTPAHHNSDPNLLSDVSSECSDLEDTFLEPEDKHNITDIAFAEDTDGPFINNAPTFEIDLSDDPLPSSSQSVTTPIGCHSNPPSRRTSEMRDKLNVREPKPFRNLSLKHSGMIKSHSSPSLAEIGCFGFRGEDYYRNCAHIVAEARQREKLKDFRGANELLKAAVEILIAGVQHDPDPMRREGVRRRTAEYLQIAENFATQHRHQQQSRKPIIMTPAQISALRVLSVKDKVIVVESPKSGTVHVLKTLRKPLNCAISGSSLVVRCPFMVQLQKYCVGDNAVFLLLKRVQGYELQEYVSRFKHTTPLPATLQCSASQQPDPLNPPAKQAPSPPVSPSTALPGLVPSNLVRKWAAQMVVCLSALHRQGLVYADLHPGNVLIDDFSNVCLTYITQLPGLHHRVATSAMREMFVAPEVLTGLHTVTPSADWWSLGAVLFYLLSGYPLSHCYPYQALRSTNIRIASEEQSGGSSLVSGLLRYSPAERLGAGVMGSEEIRAHFYFSTTKWEPLEKLL